jgi:hypothetical protein
VSNGTDDRTAKMLSSVVYFGPLWQLILAHPM